MQIVCVRVCVCVCVCVCARACVKSLSHVWLFETLKTTALQAFSVHRILQARILEWVAMLSSRGSSAPRYQRDPAFLMSPALPGGSFTTSAPPGKVKVKSLSRVRLFATPWNVAPQALLSMGFSRQEYWSGVPFPSPGDLPDPGIEPRSPALEADALTSEPPGKPT